MDKKGIKYRVIRRKVKYPRLEFKTGSLTVIVPFGVEVEPIIERHKKWILNKVEFINSVLKEIKGEKLVERDEKEFRNLVNKVIKEAEKELKVKVNKIYFRRMRTKWASCSRKGNITLNTLLKYLPEDLIRYVVFHEICHLIIPYHNKKFWLLLSQKFPNPEELEKKLFGYWFLVMRKGI